MKLAPIGPAPRYAPVSRADEYQCKAEEAERNARCAATDEQREAYERIAQSWRDLERQARISEKRGL